MTHFIVVQTHTIPYFTGRHVMLQLIVIPAALLVSTHPSAKLTAQEIQGRSRMKRAGGSYLSEAELGHWRTAPKTKVAPTQQWTRFNLVL